MAQTSSDPGSAAHTDPQNPMPMRRYPSSIPCLFLVKVGAWIFAGSLVDVTVCFVTKSWMNSLYGIMSCLSILRCDFSMFSSESLTTCTTSRCGCGGSVIVRGELYPRKLSDTSDGYTTEKQPLPFRGNSNQCITCVKSVSMITTLRHLPLFSPRYGPRLSAPLLALSHLATTNSLQSPYSLPMTPGSTSICIGNGLP